MQIEQLRLKNIGSYIGENVFSFKLDDSRKSIVLIGGRNGTGKTTLFEAIRLCLYGHKLYGYRQNSKAYTTKIKKLINDKIKKEGNASAEIEMVFYLDNGYINNKFSIRRSWVLLGNDLKESYYVTKDNEMLSGDEEQDFDNYLLHLIPPALFNFHFFNGENISQFIFDETNGKVFRNAFMQICRLDTLDLLEDQLQNIVNTSEKNITDEKTSYLLAKREYEIIYKLYEDSIQKETSIQNEIDILEDRIVVVDQKMRQFGGVFDLEWRHYLDDIKSEEIKRENNRKYLREIANNVLPFIILRKELGKLKEQIEIEEKLKKNEILKEKLFDKNTRKELQNELRPYLQEEKKDLDDKFFDVLYSAMKEQYNSTRDNIILHISESEKIDLLVKINTYMAYDTSQIIQAEKEIAMSLKKVKQIRNHMESKENVNSRNFLNEKKALLDELDLKRRALYDNKMHCMQIEENVISAKQKYTKAYNAYLAHLKAKSVIDMSAKTLLAVKELKENLFNKYISLMVDAFAINFKRLISKADLIDGIYISRLFEVVAYKNVDIELAQLFDQIELYGENYVKDLIGERAFDLVISNDTKEGIITVPTKVEQHFSAGEQQIFAMALYQSLAQIRNLELPFIIDTPLARIDSEHRKNILLHFFAQLPGQVIILSTDEEIDREGLLILKDKISDYYLITHSDEVSYVHKNNYFAFD